MNMSRYNETYKTHLPVSTVDEANQRVPQHGAVAWALSAGRKLLDEPLTARLILVAYAQYAEAAMFSPDGYSATTPEDVAYIVGVGTGTARRYSKALLSKRLLVNRGVGYRVPDSALDATWVK